GTPVSYSWLKIDGNSWKIKWQGAGRDSDYQMQIGAPAIVADSAVNKNILVTANIFNALPNAEVKIRINNQEWITMERNVRVDSVRLAMNIAEKALGEMPWRTLTSASSSRHLWEAEIDLSGLKSGAHLLEVNARDKWWDYKGYRQILIEK
ncbi:MAG: calcineurin-like phosphoesterase C-terminal domain-containing protein, partial [Bacteroidales bacterium]